MSIATRKVTQLSPYLGFEGCYLIRFDCSGNEVARNHADDSIASILLPDGVHLSRAANSNHVLRFPDGSFVAFTYDTHATAWNVVKSNVSDSPTPVSDSASESFDLSSCHCTDVLIELLDSPGSTGLTQDRYDMPGVSLMSNGSVLKAGLQRAEFGETCSWNVDDYEYSWWPANSDICLLEVTERSNGKRYIYQCLRDENSYFWYQLYSYPKALEPTSVKRRQYSFSKMLLGIIGLSVLAYGTLWYLNWVNWKSGDFLSPKSIPVALTWYYGIHFPLMVIWPFQRPSDDTFFYRVKYGAITVDAKKGVKVDGRWYGFSESFELSSDGYDIACRGEDSPIEISHSGYKKLHTPFDLLDGVFSVVCWNEKPANATTSIYDPSEVFCVFEPKRLVPGCELIEFDGDVGFAQAGGGYVSSQDIGVSSFNANGDFSINSSIVGRHEGLTQVKVGDLYVCKVPYDDEIGRWAVRITHPSSESVWWFSYIHYGHSASWNKLTWEDYLPRYARNPVKR